MAKKKGRSSGGGGSKGRNIRVEKKPANIPHADCEHCVQLQPVERVLYVGAIQGMFWRCKVCLNKMQRGTNIVKVAPEVVKKK